MKRITEGTEKLDVASKRDTMMELQSKRKTQKISKYGKHFKMINLNVVINYVAAHMIANFTYCNDINEIE